MPSATPREDPPLAKKLGSGSSETSQSTACQHKSDITADCIISLIRSYSPPDHQHVTRQVFQDTVRNLIREKQPLQMVLPAFPFKSPNRMDKVLGASPDLGEEIALARLEGLCAAIEEIYPNTYLTIVSDGLVYNDLLGVPDSEVYQYGTELRSIAATRCPHIGFARLSRLLGEEVQEASSLEEYISMASWYRDEMVKRHLPADFDVKEELAKNVNALMTYRGYIKFLETDFARDPSRQGISNKQVKKANEITAKQMIARGVAFSAAVQQAFPNAVRISIHASESSYKQPIAVLPGRGKYTTPWHCACALELDGSFTYAHSSIFANDPSYELVYRDEAETRPFYFRRKSDLYHWQTANVNIEPIYPCGLQISPKTHATMNDIDMQKVRHLAEINSPILLRGFSETKDIETFKTKAREMGSVMPWKFGEVLVVKDAGTEAGGLNNVLSAEAMPMHFDGLFKTKEVITNGVSRLVPQPPQFQFFTVVTPSDANSGYTLLASSRLLFDLLPAPYTVSQLEKLTWSVSTTAFNNTTMHNLDLVVPHPATKTPCLRYHEPWLQDKTKFDPSIVHIENGSDELPPVLDGLLYDRRVCYYHSWKEGDLLVSDNISMLHTRSAFVPGAPRELWRIHVD